LRGLDAIQYWKFTASSEANMVLLTENCLPSALPCVSLRVSPYILSKEVTEKLLRNIFYMPYYLHLYKANGFLCLSHFNMSAENDKEFLDARRKDGLSYYNQEGLGTGKSVLT
jgi:hypothetical protein